MYKMAWQHSSISSPSQQDLAQHKLASSCSPSWPHTSAQRIAACIAADLQSWPLASEPIIPALKEGERPNFIVILVDDMGLDDIGAHHPRGPDGLASIGAQTPNIDRLIRRGSSFRSFYTAPLCAMSRAELLTGREYLR